jgi:hypothetical protein
MGRFAVHGSPSAGSPGATRSDPVAMTLFPNGAIA